MGLYQKMHAVMCASEAILKEMTVGKGNNAYKAISESAVLNGIKPLLKEHGLILFPVETKITEDFREFEGKYGTTQRFVSTLHAKYKIVDIESGESEILETVGYGADSQDKGSGKAMTYAYKALLQKTFMLFSGEDTDNSHSDDITQGNSNKNVTQAKLSALESKLKSKGKTMEALLAHMKLEKIETYDQWNQAMKILG